MPIDALTLLSDLSTGADTTLIQVFTPVTAQQAAWRPPDSLANTIGATFFHVYAGEDEAVSQATGSEAVFARGGWGARLGYDHATVWSYRGAHDPAALLDFARGVSEATREYLARATPEDLERPIETRRGPRPLLSRLSLYLVSHKFQHMGEIAALLGCQGVKGLPF